MLDMLKAFLPTAAKAVAAFLTPFVLLGLGWVAEKLGVPKIEVSPDQLETWINAAIVAVVSAVGVYRTTNRG